MDTIVPIMAAFWGLFAGVFILGAVGRWLYAIVNTVQTYQANAPGGRPQRTLLWTLPLVVVLHSGPWILAIAGYLSYYLLSRPHASWWLWFYVGASFAPVLMVAILVHARWRRKQLEAKRENVTHAA